MGYSATSGAKRALAALALAMGFLTVVPALSSVLVISSALSNRSDIPAPSAEGGSTTVHKNGETPAWMAEIIDRAGEPGVAEITIDPSDGLSI